VIAAAAWPREQPEQERLLCIDPTADRFADARVRDLPSLLAPGDLLVVNDAATVPASLRGLREDGTPFEVRLLAHETSHAGDRRDGSGRASTRWRAVLFGRGDWRQRTEDRPPPPQLRTGERIRVAGGVVARVEAIDPRSPRLVLIAFEGDASSMWHAIYDEGRPVQYAYIDAPLALWHVQSPFASRPWAVEPPSAGRPLTFGLLQGLRRRGIGVVALTHAAGLSSSGDAAVDALLPLSEHYDLPEPTVRAIAATRLEGRHVVAVGTTVVRALEGCAASHRGTLVAGEGSTDLRLDARSLLRVVSGLLTGIHEPGTSHYALMSAFMPAGKVGEGDGARGGLLSRALEHAASSGYLQHEFGDSVLVLPYLGRLVS
jgi:S-adenosylmethionine:tRNA ribosyltransferase-isomerase